jgi:hypothetical protein
VIDQGLDLRVGDLRTERRHARSPDRGAAVLDQVEEIPFGVPRYAGGIGDVDRAHQEEGRAPRAPAILAVARDAVRVVQALAG